MVTHSMGGLVVKKVGNIILCSDVAETRIAGVYYRQARSEICAFDLSDVWHSFPLHTT